MTSNSKIEMYVMAIKAVSTKENGRYPEGEKHAVLAHAKASSHDDAIAVATNELELDGWIDVVVYLIGTIDTESEKNKEDSTIITAKETGFSAVIYSDIEA